MSDDEMVTPANLESGDAGSKFNPTWYEGNGWSFRTRGRDYAIRDATLTLKAPGHENIEAKAVEIDLTDRQIAKLLYAGQMGYFQQYGHDNDA